MAQAVGIDWLDTFIIILLKKPPTILKRSNRDILEILQVKSIVGRIHLGCFYDRALSKSIAKLNGLNSFQNNCQFGVGFHSWASAEGMGMKSN